MEKSTQVEFIEQYTNLKMTPPQRAFARAVDEGRFPKPLVFRHWTEAANYTPETMRLLAAAPGFQKARRMGNTRTVVARLQLDVLRAVRRGIATWLRSDLRRRKRERFWR